MAAAPSSFPFNQERTEFAWRLLERQRDWAAAAERFTSRSCVWVASVSSFTFTHYRILREYIFILVRCVVGAT